MYQHEVAIRVRYSETDQMGYVYHGHYVTYCEVARVEAMRHLGIRYADLEKNGIGMPVINLQAKYLKPAFYDDELMIRVTIPEIPSVRIKFTYEFIRNTKELIHQATTELVFIDLATKKIIKAPESIINALKSYA